jgi:hypothetical protein
MSCSTALATAPTTRSTTAPCFTNRIVGIDRGCGGLGDLLEDRRDPPARAAPLGPEIDHHETLCRGQHLVEVQLGQVDRLGHVVIPARTHRAALPVH